MKKVILAAAVLVASASVANAEGYNRVLFPTTGSTIR